MSSLAQTLVFSEDSNTFESFVSFHPEMMCTLGDLLVTFSGGDLYTHDNPVYNNFYGVDYPSSITFVFNQNEAIGKRFLSIDERGSVVWECPEIETSLISYGTTPQQSNLIEADFELVEGKWCANFYQDENSIGGLIDGDDMRGFYIKIKFQITSAQQYTTLSQVLVNYIESPVNK